MTTTIEAVYESGVFRPLTHMELTEGRHVKITVDAEESTLAELAEHYTDPQTLTDAEMQARLEIVQSIAALAVSHGGVETASRDHDKFLYGAEGAR